MQAYDSKQALIDEITKRADLFISEFAPINNSDKDISVSEVDRTPAQMIAYQLGWMNLILSWEQDNQNGKDVITPTPDYKWNNLGGLYQSFYDKYADTPLEKLIETFRHDVARIIQLVESYQDKELFEQGGNGRRRHLPAGRFGNGFILILSRHLKHFVQKLENGKRYVEYN